MVKRHSYGDKQERKKKLRHIISSLESEGFIIKADRSSNNRISEYDLLVNGDQDFKLMIQMRLLDENGRTQFDAILFKKSHDSGFGKYEEVTTYANQVSTAMFVDKFKKDLLAEAL